MYNLYHTDLKIKYLFVEAEIFDKQHKNDNKEEIIDVDHMENK